MLGGLKQVNAVENAKDEDNIFTFHEIVYKLAKLISKTL